MNFESGNCAEVACCLTEIADLVICYVVAVKSISKFCDIVSYFSSLSYHSTNMWEFYLSQSVFSDFPPKCMKKLSMPFFVGKNFNLALFV